MAFELARSGRPVMKACLKEDWKLPAQYSEQCSVALGAAYRCRRRSSIRSPPRR